jgi:hypothetical protein
LQDYSFGHARDEKRREKKFHKTEECTGNWKHKWITKSEGRREWTRTSGSYEVKKENGANLDGRQTCCR